MYRSLLVFHCVDHVTVDEALTPTFFRALMRHLSVFNVNQPVIQIINVDYEDL